MPKRKLNEEQVLDGESSERKKSARNESLTQKELVRLFGREDFVDVVSNGKRKTYCLSCPVEGCSYKGQDLHKHLTRKSHRWSHREATLTTSFIVRQYNFLTKETVQHKPKVCTACNRFFDRIDTHLEVTHKIERATEKQMKLLQMCTEKSERLLHQFRARAKTCCTRRKWFEEGCCIHDKKPASPPQDTCIPNTLHSVPLAHSGHGFSSVFASAQDSLCAFEHWLMKYKNSTETNAFQVSKHVQTIWDAVDDSMSLNQNQLADPDKLEERYFNPILETIAEQQKLPLHIQKVHTQPGTLRSKLGSLKRYLLYVQSRRVNVGLSREDVADIRLRCDELISRLKPYEKQRQQDLSVLKAEEIITPEMCEEYGRSKHVQDVVVSFVLFCFASFSSTVCTCL